MSAVKKHSSTSLPDDPDKLKALVLQLSERVYALEEYIRLERLRKFAARSEKAPSAQYELFNEAELCEVAEEGFAEQEQAPEAASLSTASGQAPTKRAGRKALSADLPRVRIEHDLCEGQKTCTCGCQKSVIGEETSEQLDVIPAQVRVLVHVRKKYACRQCEAGVETAPLPPQPIPKSNASAGLLAHVAVAKYQDALPLHRQETMFNRHGAEIPRNTLALWMIKAGELLQPLINLLNDQLLSYPVIQCDETRIQVLNEQGRPATSDSQM